MEGCTCCTCVGYCEARPCWPSPAEATRLLDLGYARRMWLDFWCRQGGDILIVGPAAEGKAGTEKEWPVGRCGFLTPDRLCEIHRDHGWDAKPIEGRLAIHGGENRIEKLHERVALLWDSNEGRAVVARWRGEQDGLAE
jgi:hypothetical protein